MEKFRNVVVYIPETQVLVALQSDGAWWGWKSAPTEQEAGAHFKSQYGWFGVRCINGILWKREEGPAPSQACLAAFFEKYGNSVPAADPEKRWYAYDPTTRHLWLWNGPDKKGFIEQGIYRDTQQAFVSFPSATIVSIEGQGWSSVCGPLLETSGCDAHRDALVEQWCSLVNDGARYVPSAAPALPPPDQNPDPRPAPTGPCSFCETPALRWCRDFAVCASAECNAAEYFHVERCAAGSVDTPETRAESRRYAVQYLADKSEEDAQKRPEGSCAFCSAMPQATIEGTEPTCAQHERAGWRLLHRLELGGVQDTPQLRAEVLRHVAASDASLREGQREATGARTALDYRFPYTHANGETDHGRSGQYPNGTVADIKPPPEEIPLVGITPHYEWP